MNEQADKQNESSEVNTLSSRIDTVAKSLPLVLAFFTPAAYILGRAFHEGYLNYFGIDAGFFPYGFHEILMLGLNAYLYGTLYSFAPLGATILVLLATTFIAWVLKQVRIRYFKKQWKFPLFFKKQNTQQERTWEDKLGTASGITAFSLYLFLGFTIALTLFVVLITKAGSHWAQDRYNQWTNTQIKQQPPKTTFTFKTSDNKTQKLEGYVIAASQNYIALFVEKQGAMIIPQGHVDTIQTTLRK